MKRIKIIRIGITGLMLIVAVTSSAMAKDEVSLRLNLSKGSTIMYRSESSQVITQVIGGLNQVVDQSQIVEYTITVLSREEDGTTLAEVKFNRIAVDITSNGMNMKFDSYTDKNTEGLNPQFMGFSALVKKSVNVKYSPLGDVVEIIGIEEMLELILNEITKGNEDMKTQVKSVLQESISPESLELMFSGSTLKFSENGLKERDTWNISGSIKNQFILNIVSTYTLKDIEGNTATIDYSSNLATVPGEKTMMQGLEMVFNLLGTQSGTINVDITSGRIMESTMNQNITGNVTSEIEGKTMKIPMSIISESRTTVME